jgi:RNase H-fold protein (predicted Holliday junction resolvase)
MTGVTGPANVLSFDVGLKKLGVAYVQFTPLDCAEFVKIARELPSEDVRCDHFDAISAVLRRSFDLRGVAMADVCGGKLVKKTTERARARGLRRALREIERRWGAPDIVLVEYQMDRTLACVFSQLVYEYCERATVIKVAGSAKNRLELAHTMAESKAKYAKAYEANKDHAWANFVNFVAWSGTPEAIDVVASEDTAEVRPLVLGRKRLYDVADATMQAVAMLFGT